MDTVVRLLIITMLIVQCHFHCFTFATENGMRQRNNVTYQWHECGDGGLCLCGNTSLGYMMNCSNRHLRDIPGNVFPNVSVAFFQWNKLEHIPDDVFKRTISLISLDLSHNKIKTLPDGIFGYTVELQFLNIAYNFLTSIPEGIFDRLTRLKVLQLHCNNLSTIPDGLFTNTINLEVLQLSYNNLSTLPETIFYNTATLKYLKLSGNKLKTLPDLIFAKSFRLTQLLLSYNLLERLPRRLFEQTTNLTLVRLSYNKLNSLPDGLFDKAINVRNVSLTHNNLENFPEHFFRYCFNLISLSLGENRLSNLPRSLFSENITLDFLNLCENEIDVLDVGTYTNANTVRLVSSKIRTISAEAFKNSKNLRLVYLSRNNITSLSEDTFNGMKIRHLTLYGNQLHLLPPLLFRLTNLTFSLDLSSNYISEIPKGLFNSSGESHELSVLQLQRNKLKYLLKDTFAGLQNLTYLILGNNQLQWIDPDAFRGTGLQCIYLVSNNISGLVNNSFHINTLKEIHLYKNKINYTSEVALSGISSKSRLFISCESVKQFPNSTNGNVKCVNDESIPYLDLSGKFSVLVGSFEKQGFVCETIGNSSTHCKACPVGTFGYGYHKNCKVCPRGGFYQDEIGSTDCKHCNNGSFVKNGRGSSQGDCRVCPEGTNQSLPAGHRACFCKKGYFRMSRFGSCSVCTDEGLNCSRDYLQILPGYYWNWSFPKTDAEQYLSFVENLEHENGWYSYDTVNYNGSIPKIYTCAQIGSCENKDGLSVTTDGCAAGYRGWMCTKCQSNYYSVLNVCHPCPSKVRVILILFAVVAFTVAIFASIVWKNQNDNTRRSLIDKFSSRLKIVLGFYQVIGDLFESFHSVDWKKSVYFFGQILSLVVADFLRVFVRPQCLDKKLELNPLVQFKIALAFPVVLILLSVCLYVGSLVYLTLKNSCISDTVPKRKTLARVQSKLFTFVVIGLFVTYAPTCNCIFSLYPAACKTFEIYSEGNDSISLLRADYDICCNDLRSYQVTAYIATVFYIIAFPTFLFYLLLRFRVVKVGRMTTDDTHVELDGERIPLLRQTNNGGNCQAGWLKFLCENYKSQFWFWEIIEMTRKVIQTMMATLLGWECPLTRLSTIGMSVLFLTLHVKYSPMKYKFEHRLQLFSLIAIFVNILVASVSLGPNYSAPIFTILFVLDVIIIVIVIAEAVFPCVTFLIRAYNRWRTTA